VERGGGKAEKKMGIRSQTRSEIGLCEPRNRRGGRSISPMMMVF